MNKLFSLFLVGMITACGSIATPITNSEYNIPEHLHGFLSPKNPAESDRFRDYYRLDDENFYIKHISFNIETGQPYTQGGNVYSVSCIKKESDTVFEAILKNTLENDDLIYMTAIYKISDTVYQMIPVRAIPNAYEGFDNIIANKDKYVSDFVYTTVNPVIAPVPPLHLSPDGDTRPFLTKVTDGTKKGYDYWALTPLINNVDGLSFLLSLVNMSVGSRLVMFNQPIQINGTNYVNKHSPYPVYGYAHKDKTWNSVDGWKNPYYVLHYEPGPAHKYGIYWAKTPIGIGMIPFMIVNDYGITGYVTIVNNFNDLEQAFKKVDWKFFDNYSLSYLLENHHIFSRVLEPEIDFTTQMPYLPGTTIVADPLKQTP